MVDTAPTSEQPLYTPSDPTPFHGSCHCKRITYTITPKPHQPRPSGHNYPLKIIDHCQACRIAIGGLMTGWIVQPASFSTITLILDDGSKKELPFEEIVNEYTLSMTSETGIKPPLKQYPGSSLGYYGSSEEAMRNFCKDCGTSLSFVKDRRSPEERDKVKQKIERGEELTKEDKKWHLTVMDFTLGSLTVESLERARVESQWWWEHGIKWIKEWSVGLGRDEIRKCVLPDGSELDGYIDVKKDLVDVKA